MSKHINRFFNGAIIFSLLICWVFFGLLFYWGVVDREIPSVTNLESISKKEAVAGDDVQVTYSVMRLRACHVDLTRILESLESQSTTYTISKSENEITKEEIGKELDIISSFKVGLDILPGNYVYYVKLSYYCNPVQKFIPIVLFTPKAHIKILDHQPK